MNKKTSNTGYVTDENYLSDYNAYKARYAENIRESDKVLIGLVSKYIEDCNFKTPPKLLDIGCSTGNLLLHLNRLLPNINLTGGDLARSSIEEAKKNKKLKDITFQELDLFELPENTYDIVVTNAVLCLFDRQEFKDALEIIYTSLREGGALFVFDWIHPFEHQDVVVYETSMSDPDGIRLCFRPIKKVAEELSSAGFSNSSFHPFEMPIDLEKPAPDEDVVSYTVTSQESERMTFRGVIFQPWCHVIATK